MTQWPDAWVPKHIDESNLRLAEETRQQIKNRKGGNMCNPKCGDGCCDGKKKKKKKGGC